MRARGDDGVTLVELLVCIAIMGVVASALAMSFFASTRAIEQSSLRMANTHDSQMAASLFSSDMQSANRIWTDTAPAGFQTCGSDDSLVTFAWISSDSQGGLSKVATYEVINQDGERQLIRQLCSGPVFQETPTSTVVIAHNLDDTTPTVECFNPGNETMPVACSGQHVIVAELKAHARANGADGTGFPYVLRATRRPSPSGPPPPLLVPSTPDFVQTAADEERRGTTNEVPFDQANTTGNLIVAYAVWDNSGDVNVTDTSGNTYTQVSAKVPWTGGKSAQVFYARNVAGGTNTVTATFATALSRFGLLYITEYSGIDKTNPFDVASIGGTGPNGSAMSSVTKTTTNANDLLVGLGASDRNVTAPGAGYTSRNTRFGNIIEDRTVIAAGAYTATATHNGNGWVMQLVAFRADAGSPP